MQGEFVMNPEVHRFHPIGLDNAEDPAHYEPGGFHPVHLNEYYDNNRYRVIHKLGAGGFSTVWLAQDTLCQGWVGLKFIVADESENYNARSSAIIADPILASSELLVTPEREFWVNGPNGRHLCFVLPFVGPNLSTLSAGIYTRISSRFAANFSKQAAQAMELLHRRDRCHGDFTASNISLALSEQFVSNRIEDLYRAFGSPKISPFFLDDPDEPVPGPQAPQHFVQALNFFACSENILAKQIRILDFDQSFRCDNPPKTTGTPAKYMAPEVIAGEPPSKASDVWSLGCIIFLLRAGRDIFFDHDTFDPASTLQQIHRFLGDLPDNLARALFDDDGYPTEDGSGEPLKYFRERVDLEAEVKKIWDEPPSLSMRSNGEIDTRVYTDPYNPEDSIFSEEAEITPYPPAYRSMFWKPTAVAVDGEHYLCYEDADSPFWGAFPLITDDEAESLTDLLSRIFVYDPSKRLKIQEVLEHPWFKQYGALSEEDI